MKTLLALHLFALALPAFASNKPIIKDGYVLRTIQQDAELKDWISGMIRENDKSKADLATVNQQVTALAEHDQAQTALVATRTQERDAAITEAHENAKERDVVVFAFALAIGLAALGAANKISEKALPWWSLLLIFFASSAAGYAVGRFILFTLARFIP